MVGATGLNLWPLPRRGCALAARSRGVRLVDEAPQTFGQPVIAPRLAAVAVIGDNQAMEIKVKPVLDRPQSTLATSLLARASAAPSRLVQSPIATSLCGIWHE